MPSDAPRRRRKGVRIRATPTRKSGLVGVSRPPAGYTEGMKLVRSPWAYLLAVVAAALTVLLLGAIWTSAVMPDECASTRVQCGGTAAYVTTFAPPAILLTGGVAAFVLTFRRWTDGTEWRVWHGVGWALFVAMMLFVGFSAPMFIET